MKLLITKLGIILLSLVLQGKNSIFVITLIIAKKKLKETKIQSIDSQSASLCTDFLKN